MNNNIKFYFFGFEPVFILGLSYVLKKNSPDAEIIDINTPDEDTFAASSDGYVFLSKGLFLHFAHLIKGDFSNKIILIVDDLNDVALDNITFDKLAACFTFSVDISEIEFGLHRVLNGQRYVSQSVLQEILPNITFNKKVGKQDDISNFKLSNNESAILKYMQEGLSNKEIYSVTGLKPSTISTYKKRIFDKFNTKSIVRINRMLSIRP
jgi:DNA-binding NarL/FixJ family response regulator